MQFIRHLAVTGLAMAQTYPDRSKSSTMSVTSSLAPQAVEEMS